jgi:hypothetical protein
MGFPVHRIGALWDVNQGRVSEIIGERRERDMREIMEDMARG